MSPKCQKDPWYEVWMTQPVNEWVGPDGQPEWSHHSIN